MLQDWRVLEIGDIVHFYGSEFDGTWDDVCTIIEINDDCIIADDNGIRLVIDNWSMDMFRKG